MDFPYFRWQQNNINPYKSGATDGPQIRIHCPQKHFIHKFITVFDKPFRRFRQVQPSERLTRAGRIHQSSLRKSSTTERVDQTDGKQPKGEAGAIFESRLAPTMMLRTNRSSTIHHRPAALQGLLRCEGAVIYLALRLISKANIAQAGNHSHLMIDRCVLQVCLIEYACCPRSVLSNLGYLILDRFLNESIGKFACLNKQHQFMILRSD